MMVRFSAKTLDDLAGTAVQLSYEYEDWTCDHLNEMYKIAKQDNCKYSIDDLHEATLEADKARKKGMKYDEAINYVKQIMKKEN
jgi:hypothetical protein